MEPSTSSLASRLSAWYVATIPHPCPPPASMALVASAGGPVAAALNALTTHLVPAATATTVRNAIDQAGADLLPPPPPCRPPPVGLPPTAVEVHQARAAAAVATAAAADADADALRGDIAALAASLGQPPGRGAGAPGLGGHDAAAAVTAAASLAAGTLADNVMRNVSDARDALRPCVVVDGDGAGSGADADAAAAVAAAAAAVLDEATAAAAAAPTPAAATD